MLDDLPNHYATLGLHYDCTTEEIRKAYRILAKASHPDVNPDDPDAAEKTHALTDAYRILSNSTLRSVYDEELKKAEKAAGQRSGAKTLVDIKQDVLVGMREFIEGTELDIHVEDPANASGSEIYQLEIPAGTAPGTRIRIQREAPFSNGCVIARIKARPDFRFKARGSDLRCDLTIPNQLAETGGTASVTGVAGNYLEVEIPEHCPRGEVIAIEGEGLPTRNGGRGKLLVRIMYRPDVRVTKAAVRKTKSGYRQLG